MVKSDLFPVIKKLPENLTEYIERLASNMKQWPHNYFSNYKAEAWQDFDFFHTSDHAVTRRELVMPDELLLIDRMHMGIHLFAICKIGKHKSNKRVKVIAPVVAVRDLKYWVGGYFLLPELKSLCK